MDRTIVRRLASRRTDRPRRSRPAASLFGHRVVVRQHARTRRSTATTLSLFAAFFRIISGKDEKTGRAHLRALVHLGAERRRLARRYVARSFVDANAPADGARAHQERPRLARPAPQPRHERDPRARRGAGARPHLRRPGARGRTPLRARLRRRALHQERRRQLPLAARRQADRHRLRAHLPSRKAGHPPRRRRRGARPDRRGHVLLLHPALPRRGQRHLPRRGASGRRGAGLVRSRVRRPAPKRRARSARSSPSPTRRTRSAPDVAWNWAAVQLDNGERADGVRARPRRRRQDRSGSGRSTSTRPATATTTSS